MACLIFFLTLTANEASSLRWVEITHIEYMVQKIDPSLTWNDCPVKCASYSMVDLIFFCIFTFYQDPIYVVVLKNTFFDMKYNFAYRCMHTLFCVDSLDVEQIENEIIATVPAMFNTTLNFFLEPIDPH